VPQPRPVGAGGDAGDQRGQQGEHDSGADERDEHPAEPHAAQERHRDDDQRQQRDGHGPGRGDHRVPRRPDRLGDGVGVVTPVLALLAPAVDDEQRVVDRHAEAHEGDEELHDEADVDGVGERQQAQERREDRHGRDEQGHEGQERREHEDEHDERTDRAEHRLAPDRRRLGLRLPGVAALRQLSVARRPDVEAGRALLLLEVGPQGAVHRQLVEAGQAAAVDDAVRRAAVVRGETLLARVPRPDHPVLRELLLEAAEHRVDLRPLLGDGAARCGDRTTAVPSSGPLPYRSTSSCSVS
jgi:hypothetical protein